MNDLERGNKFKRARRNQFGRIKQSKFEQVLARKELDDEFSTVRDRGRYRRHT
jgi:hypothetical protein